jgi:[ribosomal protein S5]-alanine N-acetyltransferase
MTTMIETPRLRLRPLAESDAADLYRAVDSDPEVTWLREAKSEEQSRAGMKHRLDHWREHGFGQLAVIERGTGVFLGRCGLEHLEDGPDVELGYYLGRAAWRKGYATEAAVAVLAWGFDDLDLDRIVAVVRPFNAASKRVLGKLGFRYVGAGHHYEVDTELWEKSPD